MLPILPKNAPIRVDAVRISPPGCGDGDVEDGRSPICLDSNARSLPILDGGAELEMDTSPDKPWTVLTCDCSRGDAFEGERLRSRSASKSCGARVGIDSAVFCLEWSARPARMLDSERFASFPGSVEAITSAGAVSVVFCRECDESTGVWSLSTGDCSTLLSVSSSWSNVRPVAAAVDMFDIAETGLDGFVESASGDCPAADPATIAGTLFAVAFRESVLLLSLL